MNPAPRLPPLKPFRRAEAPMRPRAMPYDGPIPGTAARVANGRVVLAPLRGT